MRLAATYLTVPVAGVALAAAAGLGLVRADAPPATAAAGPTPAAAHTTTTAAPDSTDHRASLEATASRLGHWVGLGIDRVFRAADPHGVLPRLVGPSRGVLRVSPVPGVTTSPFGFRPDPFNKRRRRFHSGIDFRGDYGAPIRAAASGVVVKARWWGGYGRAVIIDHGLGLQTLYGHLARSTVREGDFVLAGEVVGKMGHTGHATGTHLHFEVRQDGVAINPHLAYPQEAPDVKGPITSVVHWLEPAAAVAHGTALID